MKQLLANFSAMLRASALPVSTAEVLDAARALERLPSLNRAEFFALLQTTLVKNRRDQRVFERCFSLFFDDASAPGLTAMPSDALPDDPTAPEDAATPAADALRRVEAAWLEEAPRVDAESAFDDSTLADDNERALRRALLDLLNEGDPRALSRLRALATGDVAEVSEAAREGAMTGLMLMRLRLQAMGVVSQLRRALRRFIEETVEGDSTLETPARRWLSSRLRQLDQVTELLNAPVTSPDHRSFTYTEREGIASKGLIELYWRDRELLVELMQRLVRKIATQRSRRLRRRKRGQLDVKKTLRASLKTDGVPIRLSHRNHKQRKGDLVILCDVSGSVRAMAQATLAMIHALASSWEKVKVFAFTDDVEEITTRFIQHDPERVLREVMDTPLFSAPRGSNYGRVLRRFDRDHAHLLGPRTTLIILGDARNTGHLTEHHLLEAWQRRVRRVLWLNPEPPSSWDTGDSEASAYQPFCTEFRACNTFGQLAAFVERLR